MQDLDYTASNYTRLPRSHKTTRAGWRVAKTQIQLWFRSNNRAGVRRQLKRWDLRTFLHFFVPALNAARDEIGEFLHQVEAFQSELQKRTATYSTARVPSRDLVRACIACPMLGRRPGISKPACLCCSEPSPLLGIVLRTRPSFALLPPTTLTSILQKHSSRISITLCPHLTLWDLKTTSWLSLKGVIPRFPNLSKVAF